MKTKCVLRVDGVTPKQFHRHLLGRIINGSKVDFQGSLNLFDVL